jgi:hypothetical protein
MNRADVPWFGSGRMICGRSEATRAPADRQEIAGGRGFGRAPAQHGHPPMRLSGHRSNGASELKAVPLDNASKYRILAQLKPLLRKSQKFKHYGLITDKVYEVARTLLLDFHNSKTGLCYPSIGRIAQAANCSDWLVKKALRLLEMIGLVVRYNRNTIAWLWDEGTQRYRNRWIRTSNCYVFNAEFGKGEKSCPQASMGAKQPETVSKKFAYSLNKMVGEALTRLASEFQEKPPPMLGSWRVK